MKAKLTKVLSLVLVVIMALSHDRLFYIKQWKRNKNTGWK